MKRRKISHAVFFVVLILIFASCATTKFPKKGSGKKFSLTSLVAKEKPCAAYLDDEVKLKLK